jgi:hypothetical protein
VWVFSSRTFKIKREGAELTRFFTRPVESIVESRDYQIQNSFQAALV